VPRQHSSPAEGFLVVLLLSVVAAISACGGQGATSDTAPRSTATAAASTPPTTREASPCGRIPPGSGSYAHVIWIWMENKSLEEIIGSASAPFQTSLAAHCGLATNYHNITHPSLPNYIAATSGLAQPDLQRFRSDCDPSSSCSTGAASIFNQAPSWRAYEESMPSPCDRVDSGPYAVRHNPPPYFTALPGCQQRDLPLAALSADLESDSLPAFAFVTPNLCHDVHDCPVRDGDTWLAREVPRIVASPAYRANRLALFITYDEGEGGSSNDCAKNQADVGCRVTTLVVSPSTPAGRRSGELFNHYSLLRTTEDLLGLGHLGEAAAAASMSGAFGLTAHRQ
jgi:phosphatidylinositol-3-phosphatase